jgi:PKD repeat protein
MRTTTFISALGAAALTVLTGCTVKDIDQPALAGPSTFAHSIIMVADRDTLTQNGVDFTDIRITSLGPGGQSETIPLRAQITVDGIAQDFGTLSTKTPITPTTIRYTAPPGSPNAGAQVPTTVTIIVTPTNAGDFRGEFIRQLDIQLLPQGIILPTNPNLLAEFTVNPPSPQAFQTATFDASATTNNGFACLSACTYAWNFGDGTSGTGITVTHQYRTFGNMSVTLTVTDARGATATRTANLVVGAPTPPTAIIEITPQSPVVGQDVFFSASRTTSPTGRAIVSYEWSFGDGSTGGGVTTSHRYTAPGTYAISLKVTDDVGVFAFAPPASVNVAAGGPTVAFTFLPAAPRVNQTVTVNITATPTGATTIQSYSINWGDGGPVETGSNPTQSHTYGVAGQFVISVTATDSLGHSRTATQAITITP